MADVLILIIVFIGIWLVTVQLLKWSFENDDDVMLRNMHDFRVKIVRYTCYKKHGALTARYGGNEYVFIDKDFIFRDILEYNIGNFLFISFISKVEGIFLFETVMYLTDVRDGQYKHFDKWN
jgi:hypothetical protein